MKKFLSAVLCAAMIITAVPMTYAQSVSSLLTSIQSQIPMVREVKPDADIVLKKASDIVFVDGPLTVEETVIATTYDFKATLDMSTVRQAFTNWMTIARGYAVSDTDLQSRINNLKVKGDFVVEITYPNAIGVPSAFTTFGTNMNGFTASGIFKETGRSVSVVDANTSKLTINVSVIDTLDTVDYVLASDMETYLSTYLADMDLTCTGILPVAHGTYTVKGAITGHNYIYDGTDHVGTINYTAVQAGGGQLAETLTLTTPSSSANNVSGGSDGTSNKVTVEFVTEGDTHHSVTKVNGVKLNVEDIEEPEREGFAFAGWYAEEYALTPVSGDIELTEDTTIYAKWINTTAPAALNNDDRVAYVIGYPDGDVRPNANITREEIATIFYRLLKKEIREELYAEENSFADVEADRWSNEEISTMANGKYIKGYEDGSFRPEDAITRGEFVTIAARFLEETVDESYKTFSDINDHWAEDAIHAVADQEWVGGYQDGTFRPDALITRAEAMTIINRMLVYHIDHESLVEGVKHWPDNQEDDWFYLDVLTATNTRDHSIRENGYTEDWHEILPNPDWSVIK